MRGVIFCLMTYIITTGQVLSDQDSVLIPAGVKILKGYAKEISGESIDYHSFHPFAKQALLSRTTDGTMSIEWETEPIPEGYDGEFAYFVWIAGHSSGTSGGDRSFDLFLNGERWFTIRTSHAHPQKFWRLPGPDNSTLTFQHKWSDQIDDMYGYICLKVPVSRVGKGTPLRLKVVGAREDSRDWYMTFKYTMAESLIVKSQPALFRNGKDTCQLVEVFVDHAAVGGQISVTTPGQPPATFRLDFGWNSLEVPVPAVKAPTVSPLGIEISGAPGRKVNVTLKPVTPRSFYFLPHSHNDIGYSDIQTDVEKKQHKNLRDAVALARRTANYPLEARFKWNSEIMWAVESYLDQATDSARRDFINAVKQGSIGLQALYANELTGICRPEELFHLTDCARRLSERYGLVINSAMITDIPGYTWSIVPALAQCGIEYLSSGPNYVPSLPDGGDRIGGSTRAWGDRPFYWTSPSGKDKILFWVAGRGYSWFHGWIAGKAGSGTKENLFDYLTELDSADYPYDLVQVRYTVVSDNGPVDPALPDFVRSWNEKYLSPKIVISTSSQMFEDFEKKYGDRLPVHEGDFTPYWEDGALSTARELSLVKKSAERLLQTEVMYSMINPNAYDAEKFYQAWRNILLFDEHTWGAWNSISEPDSPFVTAQWSIKQRYALDADSQSKELLKSISGSAENQPSFFEVLNTNSWPRTDLVILAKEQSGQGDRVTDESGKAVPSQRLSTGELAFLASDVPAMGSKRYRIGPGTAKYRDKGKISAGTLENQLLRVTVNEKTGSIVSLRAKESGEEFADTTIQSGINEYLYVPGRDPASALKSGPPRISIKERGPLVYTLTISSDAPGCNSLTREVRLADGMGRVDIFDTIDKKKVRDKEAVHVAFPFSVPGGQLRTDNGWGIVRPDTDQLAGSCHDYLSAQRWVDISGPRSGVTWATDYAALIEVGEMTSEIQSAGGHRAWRESCGSSTTFYSYVMNNYWHTNYKADQEGPVTLRYAIHPHGGFDPTACYRFGVEINQPLILRMVGKGSTKPRPLIRPSSPAVVITSIKPSEDGQGVVMRLFNTRSTIERTTFGDWPSSSGLLTLSGPNEDKRGIVHGGIEVQPFGIATLRYDFTK